MPDATIQIFVDLDGYKIICSVQETVNAGSSSGKQIFLVSSTDSLFEKIIGARDLMLQVAPEFDFSPKPSESEDFHEDHRNLVAALLRELVRRYDFN